MFARFRASRDRLQVSIVETRRADGKVRYEHVAGLGSIAMPPSVADRVAFWRRLHERMARLSNRLNGEVQGKLLAAIHARIPMPTIDEQRSLQLENAKADFEQWQAIRGLHAGTVEDHKGLAATTAKVIAEGEAQVASADMHINSARDRVERIERGENVEGGLGKPATFEEVVTELKRAYGSGFVRHCEAVHAIGQMGDAVFEEYRRELNKETERFQQTHARAFLRRRLQERGD